MALAAALDTTVRTEAIRVYLGIAELVWAREKKKDKQAYIGLDLVYLASGVDPRTLRKTEVLDDLHRLGVDHYLTGVRGEAVDSHGQASSWGSTRSAYRPIPLDAAEAPILRNFLDPRSTLWGQSMAASSGWRLAMVLVGRLGLASSTLTVAVVAAWLGWQAPQASKSLKRLHDLGVVRKAGRAWVWDPDLLRDEVQKPDLRSHLTYNETVKSRQAARWRRQTWIQDREKWVDAKDQEQRDFADRNWRRLPPVTPDHSEIEKPPVVADAAIEERVTAMRARLRGPIAITESSSPSEQRLPSSSRCVEDVAASDLAWRAVRKDQLLRRVRQLRQRLERAEYREAHWTESNGWAAQAEALRIQLAPLLVELNSYEEDMAAP